MEVSLDALCLDLESEEPADQMQALDDLTQLGLQGGDVAIAAVCARLEDDDFLVRRAAVKTLSKVLSVGVIADTPISVIVSLSNCSTSGSVDRVATALP